MSKAMQRWSYLFVEMGEKADWVGWMVCWECTDAIILTAWFLFSVICALEDRNVSSFIIHSLSFCSCSIQDL